MGKALWTILALGVVGAGCLTMAMCLSLQTLTAGPAGARARLAEDLRSRFGLNSVRVQPASEEGRKTLLVTYEISRDDAGDPEEVRQEMKAVAERAARLYPDERERREFETLRVTRTAVRSQGGPEARQTIQEDFPNPERIAVEKFRYDP